MKINDTNVNNLINNKLKNHIYKIDNIIYKIVNYNITNADEEYYLLTSLIDTLLEELKILYNKRWSIETHFKEAKYITSLNDIKCESLNNLLHLFSFKTQIIYYYILN